MNPGVLFALLALVFCLWLALPFVPAVLELYRRTDIAPLAVQRGASGATTHFAQGFRAYLDAQLERLGPLPEGARAFLPDSTPIYIVDEDHPFKSEYPEKRNPPSPPRVLIATVSLCIPSDTQAFREVYGRSTVVADDDCTFRGIFAERDLTLGARNSVLRWTHSGGILQSGPCSQLYGRTTSDRRVEFGDGTRFERVFAPVISFDGGATAPPPDSDGSRRTRVESGDGKRYRVEGNFHVAAGSSVHADLIVTGNLFVGNDCLLLGSIKCRGDAAIGRRVRAESSIVCEGNLCIGEGSYVNGPVIGEKQILVSRDCRIGAEPLGTTITAPVIYVSPEVSVFGTIWARELGLVSRFEG